jgi:hypothetical protein
MRVAAHQSAQSVALRRHNTHRVTDDIVRLTGHPPVSLRARCHHSADNFIAPIAAVGDGGAYGQTPSGSGSPPLMATE